MISQLCLRNLIGNKKSLFEVAVSSCNIYSLSWLILAVDLLPHLPCIFRDKAAGRIDDVLGGAVIPLKFKNFQSAEAFIEVQYIGYICPSE